MEPGTIHKSTNGKSLESLYKSKQVLETFLEKSHKRMRKLKKALAKEKEKNEELASKIEKLAGFELKNLELHEELLSKSKEIRKLAQQIKIIQDKDFDSNSETWKQLYESAKYSKTSSADHLEIAQSLRVFIEKIVDSSYLKQFLNARKPLIREIQALSGSLSYEKLLHHVCSLSSEVITYYEDLVLTSSTMESDTFYTPLRKFNY